MASNRRLRLLAIVSAGSLALTGCAPQLATLQAGHPDDRIYVDNQYAGTGITGLRAGGYGVDRSFRITIERPGLETYEATISSRLEPAMLGAGLLAAALSAYGLVAAFQSPKDSPESKLHTAYGGLSLGAALAFFYNRARFDDAYRMTGQGLVSRAAPEPEPPAELAADKALAETLEAARLLHTVSLRRLTYRQLEEAALDGLGALAPSRASFLATVPLADDKRPFAAVSAAFRLLPDRQPARLNRAAIEAMLRAVDDPFAELVEPAPSSSNSASFAAYTGYREGGFSVLRVFEGTNAFKAGLKPGDRILSVNGKDVQGLTYPALNALLLGPEGSPLVLEVQRKGPKPLLVTMAREVPQIRPGSFEDAADGIGYVRLNRMSPDITRNLGKVLEPMADREGLVLDLRGAVGGSPLDAGAVVDFFVSKGVVARVAGRDPLTLPAAGDLAVPERVRMVILVDGGTSGGAEAIAGSLQDAKRGVLLGARTFGSGWLQAYHPLGNAYLKLSQAEHVTAAGRRIQGVGIQPDIVVPSGVDSSGRDWQVLAAVDYLANELSPEEIARKYKE